MVLGSCYNHLIELLCILSEPEGQGYVLVENKRSGSREISYIGHIDYIFSGRKVAYDIAAVISCDSPFKCLSSLLHGHSRR